MNPDSAVYVAGHNGLVGSSIVRRLQAMGYSNIITRTHNELNLTNQAKTEIFFTQAQPEYVFLAAARVGGIVANNTYRAQFIYDNLSIACNVIHAAHKAGVKKLLNLGSSCIYPRNAPQPLKEEYLLTGPLEPTNEPYAIAKISAIKMCQYYHEQYGSEFISVMPPNLYGPNDNFDLKTSHVLPAMVRKFHLCKLAMENNYQQIQRDEEIFGSIPGEFRNNLELIIEGKKIPEIILWGTGSPYREFLHVDDLAEASVFLMNHYSKTGTEEIINVGTGTDITIKEIAEILRNEINPAAGIIWNSSRPDGTPKKLLDITRIKKLGWKPAIGLKTGIRSYYTWYLDKTKI